jgi:hypothetical protein
VQKLCRNDSSKGLPRFQDDDSGFQDLRKAAVRVDPFKGRVQDQAFPYFALHQLASAV